MIQNETDIFVRAPRCVACVVILMGFGVAARYVSWQISVYALVIVACFLRYRLSEGIIAVCGKAILYLAGFSEVLV